jgi:hypothetical protein
MRNFEGPDEGPGTAESRPLGRCLAECDQETWAESTNMLCNFSRKTWASKDAVRELLAEAAAANTTRSYAAALRYWAGSGTRRVLVSS